ncbi:hypothetical protein E0I26_15810 [Flavobacterium rhamnosiphilum]|uniref:DUF3300 domain-containing protein n=1 Tax=Flavobacterium rhamnosiphilum TaxID=2541724 RepID=A0A4V2Z8W2_9FLAO|nr:hypothetical protein [Flavobacterium rhamnosiphilum]TDE41853.1 hypothetical protein E0I26_15810 [Flavobacterium rhamnosiphilum]
MKKLILSFVFLATALFSMPLFSQIESRLVALGIPGDNLNLYAVLDIFQKSKTLEEFERAINDKDTNINNLDLNNDGYVDYIQVASYRDGDSYSIVLRVAVNRIEYQDVAVIEVNKNRFGKVVIQIIGDEELYGEDYILEPSSGDDYTPNPGYLGYERTYTGNYWNGVLYVNNWPIIINLFSPSFVIYISPWHWGYYPSYWRAWTPIYYYNYWDYHRHYYRNDFYRRVGYVRYPLTHSYYYSRRNSSPVVRRNRINDAYRETYQGRDFRRPEGTVLPRTREQMRGNRSVNPRTSRSVQPMTPTRRQNVEENRQRNPSSARPVQPTAPTRRQNVEENRQQNPSSARPVQPTAPTRRQPVPRTRQDNPSITRPAPANHQRNEGTRSAPSRRPMEKTPPARTNNPSRGKDRN